MPGQTVKWQLVADASGFQQGFSKAEATFNGFTAKWDSFWKSSAGSGALAGFGAGMAAVTAATAAATASVLKFTDVGGKLADLSSKSGIAAESLQKLGYAAKLVGADQEQVAQAAVKLSKAVVDQNPAIARLGLSYQTLRGLKPEEQFSQVAEAINRLSTDTEKSAAAMDVFGKSGAELLPLLKSNISEAADEAQRLGLVLDSETVAAADKLGDSIDKADLALENIAIQFGAAIGTTDGFQQAVDDAVQVLADMGSWVKDHKDEIHGFFSLVRMSLEGIRDMAKEAIGYLKQIPGVGVVGDFLKRQGGTTSTGMVDAGHSSLSTIPASHYTSAAGDKAIADAQRVNDRINDLLKKSTADFFAAQDAKLDAFAVKVKASEEVLTGSAGMFMPTVGGLGIQTVTDAEMAAAVAAINAGWAAGEKRTQEFQDKQHAAAVAWKVTWQEGLSTLAAGFEMLGGRIGQILAGITRDVLSIGSAIKGLNFKGGITGGAGIGGLLSNLGGIASIAGAGISILKGIGGLFGFGKKKETIIPPTWEEKFQAAQDAVSQFGLAAGKAIAGLLGTPGNRRPEAQAFVNEQLGKAGAALPAIGGLAINSQASAQAQAVIFTTTFWATVKEQGLVKGVDALSAPFAALKEKLQAGGFDVNALLGGVGGLFDAVEGPARAALEAADGLNQALQGIALAGYLTQDSFNAFGQSAQDAFQQALDGNLDNQQALLAIAPLLGNIDKASKTYGLTIDANTQALIDQAKAAGIAFPTDPMERAAAALEKLVKLLGGDIPDAANTAANAINGLGNVNPGGGGVPPYHGNPAGYASGGYIPPTPGGRVVRVAEGGEGEFIVPASQMRGGGGMNVNISLGGGGTAEGMFTQLVDGLRKNQRAIVTEISRALAVQGAR